MFQRSFLILFHCLFLCVMSLGLASCGQQSFSSADSLSQGTLPGNNSQNVSQPPDNSEPVIPPDQPAVPDEEKVCGALSFSNVQWPLILSSDDRTAVRLALNISGSFEGHQGWANLSNNFDGQGFSLGLLQQNLGQGSLQTVLLQMRSRYKSTLISLFGQTNADSLLGMLQTWEGSGTLSKAELFEPSSSEKLFSLSPALNHLDVGFDLVDLGSSIVAMKNSASNAKNAQSVDWALANVYVDDGVTFKSAWKTSLQNMAGSAEYRSLQIEASLNLFAKATQYFLYFKFRELRSFLMMYDIVVQNGGFNATHKAEYADYEKNNPQATETEKLKALLEIRLKSVLSQYVSDVRSRKSTIIDGTGTVHGAKRDLPKEYCYQGNQSFIANQSL